MLDSRLDRAIAEGNMQQQFCGADGAIAPWRRAVAAARAAVLVLAAIAASTAMTPAQAAPSVEEQIRTIEDEICVAYAANDLPRYYAYYADDLRALFPEGPTSLPEYKTSWTAFIKSGGAILAFSYTDMKIQVAPGGDAAVASYLAHVRTRYPGKDPVDELYDETDVFFRRAGKWTIVEVHYSPANRPKS
jgi:ketosteroid isomerase-like protein